jgi:hypothetical protein
MHGCALSIGGGGHPLDHSLLITLAPSCTGHCTCQMGKAQVKWGKRKRRHLSELKYLRKDLHN